MLSESGPRGGCPRCNARDVSTLECPQCGGASLVVCRTCAGETCRDALCELRAADRSFRRRLRGMLTAMTAVLAVMLVFSAPLREIKLYRASSPRIPAAPPQPAPSAPPPPATVPPAPASVSPPLASGLQPPADSPPPVASAPPPPASSLQPPASPPGLYHIVTEPGLPARQVPPVAAPSAAPEWIAEVVPGVVAGDHGDGWQVPEVDEQDLRSGKAQSVERTALRARRHQRQAHGAAAAEAKPSPAPELPRLETHATPVAQPADAGEAPTPWHQRIQSVIHEALGAPYAPYGNTLRTGLSPGGLVQWVYKRLGIRSVPQMVDDQMEMAGVRLAPADYQPQVGDLLFFAIGKIHHVGIYFDANRNVFATVVPSKGGVVVADFNHPFFHSRFLFARRVAPPAP